MTVIHHPSPFRAFQTLIFLQHSAENYAPCLVVTFCCDPCALELTQLCDWEILPSTTACHINFETLMVIYGYTFPDYIQRKSAYFKTKFYITFLFFCSVYIKDLLSEIDNILTSRVCFQNYLNYFYSRE